MSAELWILVATAVLAVVAITAALVAVRAARRFAAAPIPMTSSTVQSTSTEVAILEQRPLPPSTPAALVPRVIEGRVIVPPTQQQVVSTAMGRPGVRLSIVAHGVVHALRAESRDRISALMRREYRRRRRERLQAGRRAMRTARPSASSDQWLGS